MSQNQASDFSTTLSFSAGCIEMAFFLKNPRRPGLLAGKKSHQAGEGTMRRKCYMLAIVWQKKKTEERLFESNIRYGSYNPESIIGLFLTHLSASFNHQYSSWLHSKSYLDSSKTGLKIIHLKNVKGLSNFNPEQEHSRPDNL